MNTKPKFRVPADEAVILMDTTFDAPRELVWTAFTDPEHVVHWYGGHGFQNRVLEMDVRPGGHWRHVMITPDGGEYPLHYVFVEVRKPERLSWQDIDHGERLQGMPTAQNILTLEEDGRRTKCTFVARFASLASRDTAKDSGFTHTLAQGIERMEQVLKGL